MNEEIFSQTSIKSIEPENSQVAYSLNQAIEALRLKDWTTDLDEAGITENKEHAVQILQSLVEGLLDVVSAIQKKKWLTYKLQAT